MDDLYRTVYEPSERSETVQVEITAGDPQGIDADLVAVAVGSRAAELGAPAIARHVALGIDILVHVVRDREGKRSVREIGAIEDTGVVTLWRAGDPIVRMPARLRQRLG